MLARGPVDMMGEESQSATFLFASQSVGEGHPDKLCDQISDAVLDAHLRRDPNARVACETAVKTGMVMLLGEISSTAAIDYVQVVRDAVKDAGYDDSSKDFDYKTCSVLQALSKQDPSLAAIVGHDENDIRAGSQSAVFGYATDETDECMPLTLVLAQNLNAKMAALRKNGNLPWARSDSKTQVTCEYRMDGGSCVPLRVHAVDISIHHSSHVTQQEIHGDLMEKVIRDVIPARYLDDNTTYNLQEAGTFVKGGPSVVAGLTGRKVPVDTYGGWGANGNAGFSGKDCTKVDRSAGYACRWIAKSLVKAGLCRRVLIQISYSKGCADPTSIHVNTYGTATLSSEKIIDIINKNFDLRPSGIIRDLNLRRPIYHSTACFGHFGRPEFTWEQPKHLDL